MARKNQTLLITWPCLDQSQRRTPDNSWKGGKNPDVPFPLKPIPTIQPKPNYQNSSQNIQKLPSNQTNKPPGLSSLSQRPSQVRLKLIPITTATHTGPSSKSLSPTAMAPHAMPSHKTPQKSPKPASTAPKLHQTKPPGLLSWNNHNQTNSRRWK